MKYNNVQFIVQNEDTGKFLNCTMVGEGNRSFVNDVTWTNFENNATKFESRKHIASLLPSLDKKIASTIKVLPYVQPIN